ncbi:MAG: hypothetical protein QXO16_02100 [Archaeoglobaceae archaeon]
MRRETLTSLRSKRLKRSLERLIEIAKLVDNDLKVDVSFTRLRNSRG